MQELTPKPLWSPTRRPFEAAAPELVTAGQHDPRDSWIQSCCQIIPSFKTLQRPYINAGCYK